MVLRQASDEEEDSGPAIFDIIAIDPTTTVSADSSFFQLSVTVIERGRYISTSKADKIRLADLLKIHLGV